MISLGTPLILLTLPIGIYFLTNSKHFYALFDINKGNAEYVIRNIKQSSLLPIVWSMLNYLADFINDPKYLGILPIAFSFLFTITATLHLLKYLLLSIPPTSFKPTKLKDFFNLGFPLEAKENDTVFLLYFFDVIIPKILFFTAPLLFFFTALSSIAVVINFLDHQTEIENTYFLLAIISTLIFTSILFLKLCQAYIYSKNQTLGKVSNLSLLH